MTISKTTAQSAASLARRAAREEVRGFRLTRRQRGLIIRQIFLQLFLLMVTLIVLFPVVWIISMAVDPRGVTRPTDLNLFPPNANLDAFYRLLTEPFSNVLPLYFGDLLLNSLFIALGTSVFTVVLGSSAAYAFSRFRFIGRQAGMLGFIILLLLPTTGVVIPLYVLFNSIQVDRTLLAIFPSLFTGGLIAGMIFVIFNMVRSFGRRDPDRTFNPSPRVVTAVTAVGAFVAIFIALAVMFQRSPVYNAAIDRPVSEIRAVLDEARAEYNQRVGSVAQRELTAVRREERAAAAAEAVTEMETLIASTSGASAESFAAQLDAEIAALIDSGAEEDDPYLLTLQAAQEALTSAGPEAASAVLRDSLDDLQAEAARQAERAASARASAEEARANLPGAEERLAAAQDDFDSRAAGILAIRDQAVLRLIPYALIAWVGALVLAGVIFAIVRALAPRIEPEALINIMFMALLVAVIIGFGWVALEGRMASARSGSATLRQTLLGLSLAFASGGLPFAIWNLKGYFDTIPKELEEAALIDGAGLVGTFIRVMVPLSLPAFAIVILFSFMNGWTEFILSWIFLTGETNSYTLAMALATMANGANAAPPDMQKFAAMSILISLPIMILFFGFQRWIVGGLAIGGVKG